MSEHAKRLTLRNKCNEIVSIWKKQQADGVNLYQYLIDEDNIETTLRQFRLRQVYWNYFRIGSQKLMKEGLKLQQIIEDQKA